MGSSGWGVFGSSLESETSFVPSGPEAIASTVLRILPLSTACWSIIYLTLYVTRPVGTIVKEVDPDVPPIKVKLVLSDSEFPIPSLKLSLNWRPVSGTFPIFVTVIVYIISSPKSFVPLPLLSLTVAVFSTFINGNGWTSTVLLDVDISTSVGSSTILPSPSFPSSEVSDTLFVWPGLLAITSTLFITLVVLATSELIT